MLQAHEVLLRIRKANLVYRNNFLGENLSTFIKSYDQSFIQQEMAPRNFLKKSCGAEMNCKSCIAKNIVDPAIKKKSKIAGFWIVYLKKMTCSLLHGTLTTKTTNIR